MKDIKEAIETFPDFLESVKNNPVVLEHPLLALVLHDEIIWQIEQFQRRCIDFHWSKGEKKLVYSLDRVFKVEVVGLVNAKDDEGKFTLFPVIKMAGYDRTFTLWNQWFAYWEKVPVTFEQTTLDLGGD